MSIVAVTERPDSPQGDFDLNKHSLTRKFLVQSNDVNDGPLTVGSAAGIPKLFSLYRFGNENHLYARLRHIDCERIQPGSLYWEVTCKYETPADEEGGNKAGGVEREKEGQNDQPLLMLPEIETSFETYQEVVWYVYNATTKALEPCKASNGQVFDPPPTRDRSRLNLTITRNEDISTPVLATAVAYQDAVNSDYWWGLAPGTWKVQAITVHRETKQLSNGSIFPYLRVSYKFQARQTWDTQLLDAGTYYKNDLGGAPPVVQKIRFLTTDGHPTTGPLDGHGNKLAEGATPVFLTFRFYPRLPFGNLLLPQSFLDIA